MGNRVHIQTKHEIEYGSEYFSHRKDALYAWLTEFGVDVLDGDDDFRIGDEWELDKEQLRALKDRGDEAFSREAAEPFVDRDDERPDAIDRVIDELKEFVEDCLAAPTGETAYMSWW